MQKKYTSILFLFFIYHNLSAQCNGYNNLCDKKYDEVAYLTTHNAFNSAEDDFSFPNQNFNITSQLNDGVRALMIDVYDVDGTSTVYHGVKSLGSAPLVNFLAEIKTFLDNNPNEIVTIILECYTTASKIEEDINSSNIKDYLYTHTEDNWPTLQTMINDKTRLVVFSDRNDANNTQKWYHYIWDYAVETHFSANSSSDFSCNFNRGNEDNDLFILNHFITSSSFGLGIESEAIIVNSNPYFINRVLDCYQETSKFPNFITVDFYDKGDGLDVINELNGTLLSNPSSPQSIQISILENPTKDYIKISGLNSQLKYTIYNNLGSLIQTGNTSNDQKINIQNLTNGLYFLKLNNRPVFKFIKR